MTIRNPVEWLASEAAQAGQAIRGATSSFQDSTGEEAAAPVIRRIQTDDLWDVLRQGFDDFGAFRTDVIFLCVFYPLVGLIFARLASGAGMLPLLFPLASGFALIGPLAGVGLYEMSRRREQGQERGWIDAFGVVLSPSFGAIVLLGLLLGAIFVLWLFAAYAIFANTLGPQPPASIGAFVNKVPTTPAGWTMIIVGDGIGLIFALLTLSISVISFQMMLDRKVRIETAMAASVRAVLLNPKPIAVWGLVVVCGLVVGSLPLFFGLAIVIPVLGHSSWHLYRKLVPP